ncbi:Ig-like domain-containing protein [Vibrio sp. FNV 38]|nr:Ig-like domain-containing protein [Vibrio sp. FNV 38]
MKKTPIALVLTSVFSVPVMAQTYDCSELLEWHSEQVYNGGDAAQLDGVAYQANWWTQNQSPELHSGQWQEWSVLGECGDGQPQPPVIEITSPQQGGQFVISQPIVLAANVEAKHSEIALVEFFVGEQSVGRVTEAPFTVEWAPETLGSKVITVEATNADDMAEQSSVTISVVDAEVELPPEVTLTSPSNGDEFNEGDNVTFTADASSQDNGIERVDFYLNDALIGSDESAPYEYQWSAVKGAQQVYAQAVDFNELTAKSATASFVVAGGQPGGSCKTLPQYQVGGDYAQGDIVVNDNHQYRCSIAGWCSSDAAWAYEPGSGTHWQEAWEDAGDCGSAPEVTFVAPSAGTTLLAGIETQVIVETTSGDFDIEQVAFYANDQLIDNGTLSGEQYLVNWTPYELGNVTLSAIASDSEGGEGEATVSVSVTDQALVVDLIKPVSGSNHALGKEVAMEADATSFSSDVTRVDFMVNGVVVASDDQAPYQANWISEAAGAYQVQAKAFDANDEEQLTNAVSINVTLTEDNPHKLVGYWHNFVNGSACPMNLSEIPTEWDVIDIAFADTNHASPGTNYFNLFAGEGECPAIEPNRFKQELKDLQAQGRKIVLSLGGALGTITLNDDASQQAFVSSLTDIIVEWGFDGLDVDYESGSNLVNGSEIQKRLPVALREIQENLGRDLYLTMAPEHPYVQGGYVSNAQGTVWGAYLPIIDDTRDMLDLLHVQLYNNGGLEHPYGGTSPAGSVDMMVAAQKMLVEGFDIAYGTTGEFFEPLPDSQVSIGLPSGALAAGSGQATVEDTNRALDCLVLGTSCDSVEPSTPYENFGGVMYWSINWDEYYNREFSQGVGAHLKALNER